jgi:hypothetical protein
MVPSKIFDKKINNLTFLEIFSNRCAVLFSKLLIVDNTVQQSGSKLGKTLVGRSLMLQLPQVHNSNLCIILLKWRFLSETLFVLIFCTFCK